MDTETKQSPLVGTSNSNSLPAKKEYIAPTLHEYGVITNLVNRRIIFGTDGGFPVDNDT